MKRGKHLAILLAAGLAACAQDRPVVRLRTDHFQVGLDARGRLTELTDLERRRDHLAGEADSPLLSCRVQGRLRPPVSAAFGEGVLTLRFDGGLEAAIAIRRSRTHVTFELTELSRPDDVDLIVWGPFPTRIGKTIGETVGVVRDEEFAIGLQALNPKTLGGFPWTDNDCMPQFDIFEQDDYSDLSEENKREVLYRVEAAKPEAYGSALQAYCRNRSRERVVANWGHERYVSPVFADGGVVGSKIALFGCPEDRALETLGRIELAEGLPHPMIDGVWGKTAPSASAAYLIHDFSERTIGQAVEYAKKAGLRYLYHSGPFKSWGHFELDPVAFPNGWEGLRRCVEKAEKEGIFVGVHTLSNFITTDDPYVTPVPDARLAKVGGSVLAEDVDAAQTEIAIGSPDFFVPSGNDHLRTAMVGRELVRYERVTGSPPWRLLNCQRGAWGTKAAAHASGSAVSKLADHAYQVFLTDAELGAEVACRLAELFNACGLRQISFDGLEGNRSTGMGNYGEILFTKAWWDRLSDDIKRHAIIDASRTSHYFWHIYSRMNWGEPWYAGFRESQTEYRLKNQAYFERNLMPGMLGWFSLREDTPVEDIEWMLARSAAFDAGYALVAGEKALMANGQAAEILDLVGEWERARLSGAFTAGQKERMKDIANEFELERMGEGRWDLRQVLSLKFRHEERDRQPGEPRRSIFSFESPAGEAVVGFILTAQEAVLSGIRMAIDGGPETALTVSLAAGESLRYDGGSTIWVRDASLHRRGKIDIDPAFMRVGAGRHTLSFDCRFSAMGKEPGAKLELRVPGPPEAIEARRARS